MELECYPFELVLEMVLHAVHTRSPVILEVFLLIDETSLKVLGLTFGKYHLKNNLISQVHCLQGLLGEATLDELVATVIYKHNVDAVLTLSIDSELANIMIPADLPE